MEQDINMPFECFFNSTEANWVPDDRKILELSVFVMQCLILETVH